MRALFLPFILSFVIPALAEAQNWYEPARGSQERGQIMNALRPVVEWQLGAPVEFVVQQLRASEDRAFAIVVPQRPGGGHIDIRQTPMVRFFGDDPYFYEEVGGIDVVAFLIREGDQWAVVDHSIGATDVWFAREPYCTVFPNVLTGYCPLP
ncbi:hypothetical protein [Celeribacter sp. ULVN23_4]